MSFICDIASGILGAVVPVFYSYKALKKGTKISLSYWLKYWTVYGAFTAIDLGLNSFYLSYLIPFYSVIKLAFVLWSVSPVTCGAQFMFDKVLVPFIRKHERRLEKYTSQLFVKATQMGPELVTKICGSFWSSITGAMIHLGTHTDGPHPNGNGLVFRALEHQPDSEGDNVDVDSDVTIPLAPSPIVPDRRVKIEPEDEEEDDVIFIEHRYTAAMVVEQRPPSNQSQSLTQTAEVPESSQPTRRSMLKYLKTDPNSDNDDDFVSPVRRSARLRTRASQSHV